jgi:hypothetical protein
MKSIWEQLHNHLGADDIQFGMRLMLNETVKSHLSPSQRACLGEQYMPFRSLQSVNWELD